MNAPAVPNWSARWLTWLDDVQFVARQNRFPQDPELRQLRGWFEAGVGPIEAVVRLRRLKPAAAPECAHR